MKCLLLRNRLSLNIHILLMGTVAENLNHDHLLESLGISKVLLEVSLAQH